jgi:hypothetical protein
LPETNSSENSFSIADPEIFCNSVAQRVAYRKCEKKEKLTFKYRSNTVQIGRAKEEKDQKII